MSVNGQDLRSYRRDEQLGHKLLTTEERIRLLKVRASSVL